MKLNILTACDTALALLMVAFCWGVGGVWLAVPAAGIASWALWNRNAQRELPSEQAEGLRRVRAQFHKDIHDPTGGAGIALLRDAD